MKQNQEAAQYYLHFPFHMLEIGLNALIYFEDALNMAQYIGNQVEIDKVKYEIEKLNE